MPASISQISLHDDDWDSCSDFEPERNGVSLVAPERPLEAIPKKDGETRFNCTICFEDFVTENFMVCGACTAKVCKDCVIGMAESGRTITCPTCRAEAKHIITVGDVFMGRPQPVDPPSSQQPNFYRFSSSDREEKRWWNNYMVENNIKSACRQMWASKHFVNYDGETINTPSLKCNLGFTRRGSTQKFKCLEWLGHHGCNKIAKVLVYDPVSNSLQKVCSPRHCDFAF
jgi:hypothetical protein